MTHIRYWQMLTKWLKPEPLPEPFEEFDPLWAMPLRDCLLAIMGSGSAGTDHSDGIEHVHALKTLAATMDRGLDIRAVAPSTVEPHFLPCLAILADGGGVIILDSCPQTLTLFTSQEVKIVSRQGLDTHCKQIAFLLTDARAGGFGEAEPEADNGPDDNDAPSDLYAKHGFERLTRFMLERHSTTIMQLAVTAFISNLLMMALPLFTMTVYDRVIPHGAFETLWALSMGVLLALALDTALRYVRSKLTDAATMGTAVELQSQLFRALTQARMAKTPTAVSDWTNTFRDLDGAAGILPGLIIGVLVDLPFVFVVLLLVHTLAGPVVWAALAGVMVFALWAVTNTLLMRRLGASEAKSQNARSELLTESAWLSRTIKAANAEDNRIGRFDTLLVNLVPTGHALRLIANMQGQVTMIIVQVVIVISVIIGVHQIIAGSMSVGALAATTLLVGRVLMPVGQLMMLVSRANQLSRPLKRVYALLDLPRETSGDVAARRMVRSGHIELSTVSFTFPDAHRPSLDGVSLEIKPGEKIGIIGRSGSGKSTLLQLLVRLYDPATGRYLIDNYDARQYAPQVVRGAFSYMPQEADLLDSTVHDNIMIANPAASRDDMTKALVTSGAADFLRNHPEGLSCRTGARGSRLSGGERQAVALARALIAPSSVLILDEPTSSMDNTTEAKVIQSLRETCADRTLILSTHRLQALTLVDRVIWMERGRIIADGPRVDVLARLQKSA